MPYKIIHQSGGKCQPDYFQILANILNCLLAVNLGTFWVVSFKNWAAGVREKFMLRMLEQSFCVLTRSYMHLGLLFWLAPYTLFSDVAF